MLHKSTCLGHQKWHEMHYHANALIRWHFDYESNARCNNWIPKSNTFRRFPHKKIALFLHKKLQRTQKLNRQILLILPIKNPWVSINFQKFAGKMWKKKHVKWLKSLIFYQFSRGKSQCVEKFLPFTNSPMKTIINLLISIKIERARTLPCTVWLKNGRRSGYRKKNRSPKTLLYRTVNPWNFHQNYTLHVKLTSFKMLIKRLKSLISVSLVV